VNRRLPLLVVLIFALPHCSGELPAEPDADYLDAIAIYRSEREARLRAEEGWLSLIGLYWLQEGPNSFGSDPTNAIVLPADAAPPHAGSLDYDGEQVRLIPHAAAELSIEGAPAGERVLRDDGGGKPEVIALDRLRFYVIRRGDRHAVRIKDPQSPARSSFKGLDFFPVDPAYRVEARLRRYESPSPREIPTVVGTATEMLAPGLLEFELNAIALTLEPYIGKPEDTSLFLIFKDGTSGKETYGAGRFLSATLEDDRALLDFNKAYNPPCAFTPFATCPLPPPQNRLDVAIRAGERAPAEH
jgi:uncharacterized protein (DUF1684 family)